MRGLNPEFEKEFLENGKFRGIIEYVKKQDDVFLGVRENYINLYVDGGSFFKLEYKSRKGYVGSFDEKYYKYCIERKPKKLSSINGKTIEDIKDWINLFPDLKKIVKDYQEKIIPKTKKSREKILQQKLVHEFNKNSNYFAYDIEYAIKGAIDYVYDAKKNRTNKKPKTEGRADILLISKPVNNKITIYFMEVKEGLGALSGINLREVSLGSGIVGHLKNNTKIVNLVRKNKLYESEYRRIHYPKNPTIDIKKILLQEVINIMSFYHKCGLIENKNFKDIDDYSKINLKEDDEAIKLVFFLGNYPEGCESFEHYLGIRCDEKLASDFSVKKLLDNKQEEKLNLDYITYDNMIGFKYIKTTKNCDQNGFELEIEDKYKEIRKEEFKDKTSN